MTENSSTGSRPAPQAASFHYALATFAAVTVGVMTGCGGDQLPIVPVTGTVTLDGQPLSRTLVEFQPVDPLGPPSYAATNVAGKEEKQSDGDD